MLRLQRAAPRYYQRPDAPHVSVDPAATSLSGWSGRVGLNKNSGNVTVQRAVSGGSAPASSRTTSASRPRPTAAAPTPRSSSASSRPDAWTRSRRLAVAKWWTFNYGRECQGDGVSLTAGAQLRNYWQLDLTLGKSWNTWDDKLTRGGPTTIRPGIESLNLVATSDARRRFWVSAQRRALEPRVRRPQPDVRGHPQPPALDGPHPLGDALAACASHTVAQYLPPCPTRPPPRPTAAATSSAASSRARWSIPLRVNLVLSPRLSLQLYTQALLSTGDYPQIRELAAPRTYDFPVYGVDVGTIARDPELPLYDIDPDGAGEARPFRLARPRLQLQVAPGERRPALGVPPRLGRLRGVDPAPPGRQATPATPIFVRDLGDLFAAPADDVFMVKLAWWIGS